MKNNTFHFEYSNSDESKNETNKIISNLTENQITEFIFNEQPFYKLGYGHAFLHGFFTEYITKSGIKAMKFGSEWLIDGENYEYKNLVFIKIQQYTQPNENNYDKIPIPLIKQKVSGTISDDLIPIIPI